MKKFNFKNLVSKMDNLKETEQGKIKGGIMSLPSHHKIEGIINYNCPCGGNFNNCEPPKPKQ